MDEKDPIVAAERLRVREERPQRWTYAALATLVVAGIPLVGLVPDSIQTRMILTTVLIIVFLLAAARLQTGTVLGVLVDARKKASSSRLQLLAWTILILSAYSTAALWNVSLGATDPLGIGIPAQIWAALGISVASFAGSPLLKERNKATLTKNETVVAARVSDVLMGEEAASKDSLDLGKVQMLLFTVIILVAYGAALHEMLTTRALKGLPISEFPSVDGGMLALLGISHSGYLVNKAVTPTDTQQGGGS